MTNEWEDWLHDWLLSCRHTCAPTTLTVYERGVRQFADWLTDTGHDAALGKVARRDVEAFLGDLRGRGKAESTRRVRLMSLRSFFGWVLAEPGSPLTVNPAVGIAAPMPEMPRIEVVTETDLHKILKTCGTSTFVGLRDEAMIRLLFSTGLRRAELVGLSLEDVDLKHQELLVMGKGGKPRVVTFGGSKTPLALSRYLRVRRTHPGAADRAVFLSTRGSTGAGWRITGGGVALMLKRRCQLADVKVIHPHQLRHSWAHTAKVEGLSDEDLERMAGWSSPMMVRRYGRAMADERAREAHKRLNLGDRL